MFLRRVEAGELGTLDDGSMKFFTRDWANGELDDDQAESAFDRYAAYVKQLHLPPAEEALANTSLHDALMEGVRIDHESITLMLITGDLSMNPPRPKSRIQTCSPGERMLICSSSSQAGRAPRCYSTRSIALGLASFTAFCGSRVKTLRSRSHP